MSSLDTVQSLQIKQLMLDLLATSRLPKTLAAFSNQLEPSKIIHFFKCMEPSCDYSTDDSKLFLVHLAVHQERTFSCSFCGEFIAGEARLVKHLVTVHGSCSFQCPLCFYRSYSKVHVIIHTLALHRSNVVRWYSCKVRPSVPIEPISETDLATKFYVCGEGCSFRCLSPKGFVNHLSGKHASCQQYTCHLCSKKAGGPKSLIRHYGDAHCFHFVQCLYCNFGCDTEWDVLVHVAEEHADKPFNVLLRSGEASEVFKRIKGLSKVPGSANTQQPLASSVVQPIVKPYDTCGSVSGHLQEPANSVADCAAITIGAVLCGVENCIKTFPTLDELLKHLTTDHQTELKFSCPQCGGLRNVPLEELFAHIVDTHTDLTRCPYKNCVFFSKTQQAVDDHIMQTHQSFGSDDVELIEPEESKPELTKQPECLGGNAVCSNETYDCAREIKDAETEKLYSCTMCCQREMQAQDYFRHLSFGHGVKFFCGHCYKGYKAGRLLLLHHQTHHSGLPASVKSYEQNKLSEVSKGILSGLEEELQRFMCRKAKALKKANQPVELQKDNTVKRSNESPKKCSNQPADDDSGPILQIQGFPNASKQKQDHPQKNSASPDLQSSKEGLKGEHGPAPKTTAKMTHCTKENATDAKVEESAQCLLSAPEQRVPYICGHCFRRYKVLKAVVSHMNTVHPGLPMAIKKMDVAKLDDVTNVDELLESGCPGVSGKNGCDQKSLTKNDTVEKGDTFVDKHNEQTSPLVRHRKKRRRIAVLSSDSEDDEPLSWQATTSYYGRKIEHVDYKNMFVRLQEGNVRVPYCQLACVLLLQPIVVVKKLCYI